jgi:hypothetical protein
MDTPWADAQILKNKVADMPLLLQGVERCPVSLGNISKLVGIVS